MRPAATANRDWGRLVPDARESAYASRLDDKDGSYDDDDDDEQERGEGDKATLCPLHISRAHSLDQLPSLRLGLGGLRFLRCTQGQDEEEGSSYPEERAHCDDAYVSGLRAAKRRRGTHGSRT